MEVSLHCQFAPTAFAGSPQPVPDRPQIFELVSSRQNIFLFWGKVTRDKNTHAILKRKAQRYTGANIKLRNKYVGHCICSYREAVLPVLCGGCESLVQ